MKKVLSSLLLTASAIAFGQVFSAGFETNYGPLTNWTLYNVDGLTPNSSVSYVNAAWIPSVEEAGNSIAMSTSWYTPAGTSNDWMVSPAITLPAGTNTLYWHAKSYDPTYKESYKVYISTTGNAVANFTTPALTVNLEEATWQNKSIDLSSYAGQTIYIAFQNFSNDAFLGGIDNVHVINGVSPQPGRVMTTSNITQTSGRINWTAATGVTGYDYSRGAVGHTPTVVGSVTGATTNFADITTGLAANSVYEYYVRSKNNTVNGAWIGPYRLFTAQPLGTGTPYSYGFDNTTAAFYQNDGWTGAWSTNATAGNPQAGAQMVFSNNSTTAATNRWLYSKPFTLSTGNAYTVTFYLRNFGGTNPQSIKLTVGNEATTTAQSTTLWSSTTVANAAWTQYTATFTPTTSGTYYFGFNHFSPIQAGTAVSLGLDTFNINGVLGTIDTEVKKNQISIYPNPATDFVSIKSDSKINNVEIFDASGRKVSSNLNDNKVDVRNLTPGGYIINIETKEGKTTEKFIKK
ncbi:choice-of-anchor J domain-containing protein [Chryseobacterium chendengshani]|uniref:T9SS-dependent choice-of-anchor J family protein n=1 Tax=Chryseobacterium sp. LJ668 TaxID=2864040 RepID=UPI001C69386E|nr:choice-of-anchor J domain-containing protein [Chryseobacterium sp. LJ668]MBW8522573.1 choice-of-anchor J domain-containing protein [Chryseobacterium sp. LJ668]QYK16110.1 choice-of-anchor J domain-containing protein [Chryseobacterium sp. LJ668]